MDESCEPGWQCELVHSLLAQHKAAWRCITQGDLMILAHLPAVDLGQDSLRKHLAELDTLSSVNEDKQAPSRTI